jgi:hypothetical protein
VNASCPHLSAPRHESRSFSVCGQELSTFHARRASHPTRRSPPGQWHAAATGHMTIVSCTVSRYGTMCDYKRTTAGEEGAKRRRGETRCKRPEWKRTTRRGESTRRESEKDLFELGPRLGVTLQQRCVENSRLLRCYSSPSRKTSVSWCRMSAPGICSYYYCLYEMHVGRTFSST